MTGDKEVVLDRRDNRCPTARRTGLLKQVCVGDDAAPLRQADKCTTHILKTLRLEGREV